MQPVVTKLKELTAKFTEMIAHVEAGEKEVGGFKDFHARRLVETAGHIILPIYWPVRLANARIT